MYTVELYARVRRAVHVEGRSQREVAREFGLARKTVRKMLAYPAPPGYQRQKPVLRPKLGPWQDAIDAILEQDKSRPRRQRHTAFIVSVNRALADRDLPPYLDLAEPPHVYTDHLFGRSALDHHSSRVLVDIANLGASAREHRNLGLIRD